MRHGSERKEVFSGKHCKRNFISIENQSKSEFIRIYQSLSEKHAKGSYFDFMAFSVYFTAWMFKAAIWGCQCARKGK